MRGGRLDDHSEQLLHALLIFSEGLEDFRASRKARGVDKGGVSRAPRRADLAAHREEGVAEVRRRRQSGDSDVVRHLWIERGLL